MLIATELVNTMLRPLAGFVLLFFSLLFPLAHAEGNGPVTLELLGKHGAVTPTIKLSHSDQLWLAQKRTLTIAVFPPELPPLALNSIGGRYQGMNADYLELLHNVYNINVVIKRYSDEQQALAAVKSLEADLMLTHLSNYEKIIPPFIASQAMVQAYPALVTKQDEVMKPLHTDKSVTIAITNSYPSEEFIRASFPHATIVSFNSNYQALSSVADGQNDYFIGDSLSSSNIIMRDFNQVLSIVKFWSKPQTYNYFIALDNQSQLINIINLFLNSVADKISHQITLSWIEDDYLSFLTKTLSLSPKEERWIKNNPKLQVLINPYYAPLTMLDSNLEVRGLIGDILNLIHLQTGLIFEPVIANTDSEISRTLQNGDWDLQPTATESVELEDQLSFTHPYLTTPFVAVVRDSPQAISELSAGMKVAVPEYHELYEKLKIKYPGIKWVQVENTGIALNMVEDGKLDASIYTQISARYMIEHYYPGQLKYFSLLDEEPATISFALPCGHQELQSILNKALDNISPREIGRLSGKWTTMPNIQIDTWNLYNKQFYVVLALTAMLIFSCLLWGRYLLREIRTRKQSQADLEYQLSFSNTLANSIPLPNYVISPVGTLQDYNHAFTAFFSANLRTEIRQSLFDSRHPLASIFSTIRSDIENLIPDNVILHPLILNNGVEDRHILHWSTLCVMPATGSATIICIWQDITESKRLMKEIQIEKDKAIRVSQEKSGFLASMSHEIRTPISTIMGFLELLATNSQESDKDIELIQLSYTSAQSLLELIGDILDIEKIESGHFELSPEWLDLELLINSVLRSFEGLAIQKKLKLTFVNRLVKGERLWLDPKALKQTLVNLLSNALKFTQQGHIEVCAETGSPNANQSQLILSVTDTGSGISQEDQQQLFQPFSQTEAGKQQVGSGLGLMICRKLILQMGGDIKISSKLDMGTTITIMLTTDMARNSIATVTTLLPAITAPKRIKILISDDHSINRLLLKRQLDTLGYHVDEAVDGEQALALIKQNSYDLLITDIHMPGINGIMLARHIRNFNNKIVIWGLTANAQAQERERCLASGMNLCLFKPLTLQKLENSLGTLNTLASPCQLGEFIDLEMLTTQTLGDALLIRQMLEKSQQENAKDLKCAQEAAISGDWPGFRHHLHRIKGAAQILGASGLYRLSLRLENHQPMQQQDNMMQADLLELEAQLKILSDEIDRFYAA
ncbi:ATP-binding protein [Yersinia kristensenii]|uniref:ATP-binding protein n=1 Tax=Yersinia kristensenii TaxID=28152 RepID=UPI001FE4CE18|nr:transporter substrate-binding domain-containing protein [Yersinia kristensenii]